MVHAPLGRGGRAGGAGIGSAPGAAPAPCPGGWRKSAAGELAGWPPDPNQLHPGLALGYQPCAAVPAPVAPRHRAARPGRLPPGGEQQPPGGQGGVDQSRPAACQLCAHPRALCLGPDARLPGPIGPGPQSPWSPDSPAAAPAAAMGSSQQPAARPAGGQLPLHGRPHPPLLGPQRRGGAPTGGRGAVPLGPAP